MDNFANPGLLNLQALYVDPTESHAKAGAHIRVAHHPVLALPVMPFVLEKADVNVTEFERLQFREDAVWHMNGQQIFPPFSNSDGDVATVTMPTGAGSMAIWAEIVADPGSNQVPGVVPVIPDRLPTRPPTRQPTRPPLRPINLNSGPRDRLRDLDMGGPDLTDLTDRLDLDRLNPSSVFVSAMQVEGFLRSADSGTKSLGTRSDRPFAFSGPGLAKFIIRGRGTVVGIRWLAGDQTQKGLKWVVHDVLNLPHKGGMRYLGLTNWQNLCDNRVDAQSPKRRPMQDVTGAVARTAAPGHAPAEEFDRVNTLFRALEEPLDQLINSATPQHQHVTRHALTKETGDNVLPDESASATIPTLGLVAQGQVDPGVASWLGYKSFDGIHVDDPEHRMTFYRVRGYFRNPSEEVLNQDGYHIVRLLVLAARQQFGLSSLSQLLDNFIKVAQGWLTKRKVDIVPNQAQVQGMIMGAMAVADYLAPLDVMQPPRMDKPRHIAWLPSRIDAPIRATETEVRGMLVGGALAVQMRQPQNTGPWRRLNRTIDHGEGAWRTLMLPGMVTRSDDAPPLPAGVAAPDTVIADTRTGPDTLSLHAAQMDRFGRYSDWATTLGDAGIRPKPPRPVLIGSYRQPSISSGLHSGKVTITVPLPEDDALAPGAHPLLRADITVEVDGAAFGSLFILPVSGAISIHPNNDIPDPSAAPGPGGIQPSLPIPPGQDRRGVRVTIDGPMIPATQSRALRVVARWRDTALQSSVLSEPFSLTMTDPYPPAQIAIPDVLDYAARPDATGTAWVERDIPGASTGVNYAVYYADENRLRDYLRHSGSNTDTALLTQLEAESDSAARATALRLVQTRFPGHLFERLEGAVETSPALRFRHALPGSLRVLSAYKVAVESEANAAGPDLSQLDTIFYGVPNSEPPARPSVTVNLVPPNAGEPALVAEVTVTLRAGVALASLARLKRTRSGVIDPLRNPVIGTEPFGPVDSVTGLQTAVFRDIGSAEIATAARFLSFIQYAWIAEAQGTEEPGSVSSASGSVPGLWGEASAPATLTLIPETDPVAPIFSGSSSLPAPGGFTDIELMFDYPQDLTPGSAGPWHIRVERALPDAGLSLLSENPATGGTTFSVNDGDVVPSGTRFRVRVIDPVGRESPAVEQQI